jgi:hypothetical protein
VTVAQLAEVFLEMQDAPILTTSPRSVIMTMRPAPMMEAIPLCRSNKGFSSSLICAVTGSAFDA